MYHKPSLRISLLQKVVRRIYQVLHQVQLRRHLRLRTKVEKGLKHHRKASTTKKVYAPGDRQGQIHMHLKGKKYIYDISEKAFRFDKAGEIAPRAVQKYLENEKIVIAIEKGLIILGY